jgi:hypothetical protein
MHLLADVDVVPTNLLIIPNAWVPVIVGLVLPVITALLVKAGASDRIRVAVGIVLAGITTVLTQAVVSGGDAIITWETVRLFLLTYGVEVLTYLGFWKPVSKDTVNQRVAPNVGLTDEPKAA